MHNTMHDGAQGAIGGIGEAGGVAGGAGSLEIAIDLHLLVFFLWISLKGRTRLNFFFLKRSQTGCSEKSGFSEANENRFIQAGNACRTASAVSAWPPA